MSQTDCEKLDEIRAAFDALRAEYEPNGFTQEEQGHLDWFSKRIAECQLTLDFRLRRGDVVLAGSPVAKSTTKAARGRVVAIPNEPVIKRLGDDNIVFHAKYKYKSQNGTSNEQVFHVGTAILNMDAGTSGEVTVYFKAVLEEDGDRGTSEYSVRWRLSADEDGELTIHPGIPESNVTSKVDTLRVQKIDTKDLISQAVKFPGISYVVIPVTVMDKVAKGGGGWQINGEISVDGTGGGLGGGHTRDTIETTPHSVQSTLQLNIKVNIPPEIAKKRKQEQHEKVRKHFNDGIDKLPDKVMTVQKVPYEIGPFAVGKHNKLVKGDIKSHVMDIFTNKIPEHVQELMRHNKLPQKIEVHGHASNTDTKERNYVLSKNRAKAVINAFDLDKSIFLPPEGHGEWDAKGTDVRSEETEDARHRKVVLVIYEPKAMAIPKPPKLGPLPMK
jgi:outer membrane protein OmpA-like peptidoglycan-associated protein